MPKGNEYVTDDEMDVLLVTAKEWADKTIPTIAMGYVTDDKLADAALTIGTALTKMRKAADTAI